MIAPVDPDALPPDPRFESERGPPVDPTRLTPAGLRARFAQDLPWQPDQAGDGRAFVPGRAVRPAAVLIGLREHADGLQVIFTVRARHLADHAGQISFPGGRAEPDDADACATALRETEEEIGLARSAVEVLGTINRYVTVTGYDVTPVVGLIRPPFELAPDEFEVAEVFEIPLAVVLDPSHHQRNTVVSRGARRQYFAIPHGRWYIWGATASMLLNFGRFLAAPPA